MGRKFFSANVINLRAVPLHLTRPILIAGGKRETVGSFLMDREPMYFEWHGAEIQWKGECMD